MVVTEEVQAEEGSRQGGDEESMGVELVTELHSVGNRTVDLDVISVDCKHMLQVVSFQGKVGEFVICQQGMQVTAGGGAGVNEEPWFVQVVEVAHVRLRNCQGSWIGYQFELSSQHLFSWALVIGGDLGHPIL